MRTGPFDVQTMRSRGSRRTPTFPASAENYDRMINWPARLAREIPFLERVFGPPGAFGLLDAACGTGRHALAMGERGYRVLGTDASEEMLKAARRLVRPLRPPVRFLRAAFGELARKAPGPYDGAYCIGNSLAAAGTERVARAALADFGRVVRPGGMLVLQVINFAQVLREAAGAGCIRGPQTAAVADRELVTFKVFAPAGNAVMVTNVTFWKQDQRWQKHVFVGRLFPIGAAALARWLSDAGFRVRERLGDYAGERFNAKTSADLIVVAQRTPAARPGS